MSIEKDGSEDSDEWDEMENNGEQTVCLFCPLPFHTIAVALNHCKSEHNFDLLALKLKYDMDCYSFIKLVNYIRRHKPDVKTIMESPIPPVWDDDKYLRPNDDDVETVEPWLMYDFDDVEDSPTSPNCEIDIQSTLNVVPTYADLQRQVDDLNSQLNLAYCDMDKMRRITRTLMESGGSGGAGGDDKSSSVKIPRHFSGDSDYFHSYSHFGIHHDMLNDKIRTESYRDAIMKNRSCFEGKIVLDVGCGTGILSMFSAKAGAKAVYGIDKSEVIYKTMDIVRENHLEDTIHLLKGCVEEITLPTEKVDIIVSEWMGYFLLFEGMLDSILFARDNFLRPNGRLLPNRCNISLVGCSDLERYNSLITFWDNVYGFSMKCIKADVLSEAFVEMVPPDKLLTAPIVLNTFDLDICTCADLDFTVDFVLKAQRDGDLHFLCGYFDVFFDLPNPVQFSTGPQCGKTHWQQTIFYLPEVVHLKKDEEINGILTCRKTEKNFRGLTVVITLGKNKYQYYLD